MKKTKKSVVKPVVHKSKKAANKQSKPIEHKLKKQVKRQLRQQGPLHRRIILHPASVLALLIVGVFLVTWTFRTFALTGGTTISAVIEAPALTQAATITSPLDGDTINIDSVTVTGSCPSSSYVNLTVNSIFAGTDMCSGGNTYSILASLTPGNNVLVVQDYNLTDQPGPTTPSITVDDGAVMGASTVRNGSSTPLILTSSFSYKTYSTKQNFDWTINVTGGKTPYNVSVDWSDGTNPAIIPLSSSGDFNIVHHYDSSGYHVVHLQAVDSQRNVRLLQLAALITAPGSTYVPGVTTSNRSGPTITGVPLQHSLSKILVQTRVWLLVAWPSFIIVSLMAVSFWLGERQELQNMFIGKRRRQTRRAT